MKIFSFFLFLPFLFYWWLESLFCFLNHLLPQALHTHGIALLHYEQSLIKLMHQLGIIQTLGKRQFHTQRLDSWRLFDAYHMRETKIKEIGTHVFLPDALKLYNIEQETT